MKGGRKNLKRSMGDDLPSLQEGQSIMKVASLRGSNIIEVMDAKGDKSLALFPAKFQKSIWIKQGLSMVVKPSITGSFVIVDGSGMDKALEFGHKVTCIVSQVLFYEQVRALQSPEVFRSERSEHGPTEDDHPTERQCSSDEDDDLPPLEANLNRIRPSHFYVESDADSDASSD
ncbi:putative RNA-binding protein [Nymphaea thermarum]|nr:putative RNA-binding protein [Nymphaea thermarum]